MQGIPPVDLLTHLGARYCGRHRVAGISQGYAGGVYYGALTRCACASIPRQDGDEALLSPGEDGQELDRFACRFPKVDLLRWDVTGFSCLESHIGFPVQREGNEAFEDIENLISGMIVRRACEIRRCGTSAPRAGVASHGPCAIPHATVDTPTCSGSHACDARLVVYPRIVYTDVNRVICNI
jgi:hypothetical protein